VIRRDVIAAALVVSVSGGVAASTACGAGGAGSARQERSDVSTAVNNDAASDANNQLPQLSAHPALEILIRTGTQHWATGEITLVVRGTGVVEVAQRQATETASFEGALPKDELDSLGRTLHAHRFTASRTSAPTREPGDTPLMLTLRRDGKVVFEANLWEADRDLDSDLDAILRSAGQLLHRVSAGKLGQP
jgi:hypothetical protein